MESAKMRIVLAVTLAEQGGVQQFLAGFAVWLRSQGHEVVVVAGDGHWLADRCRETNIPFVRLQKMGREISPLRDIPAILEMRKVLKSLKPDTVHLNSAKMGAIGSIAARLPTTDYRLPRIVYRIGGWTFREDLSASKRWMYTFVEKYTARFKDVIVCVNPNDVRLANEVGIKPRKEIVCVPNGIDLATFDANLKPRDMSRDTLHASRFTFGTTANFYPPKDLPRYMEACKIVHEAEPDARFLILGDGHGRAEIERKRHELGLDDVVLLPGARDDAATLLTAFDAFVLPSSKEGMSFSLLEAMAAGLPCVATDVGAAKWMFTRQNAELLAGDGGLTVPAMNPQALAEAMLRIMREPELRTELAKKARLQVETRFPLLLTYQGNLSALMISDSDK